MREETYPVRGLQKMSGREEDGKEKRGGGEKAQAPTGKLWDS